MRGWFRLHAGLVTGILVVAMVGLAVAAVAEEQPEFRIEFTNQNLAPSHWVIRLHPDGSGHFDSDGSGTAGHQPGQMYVSELHRDIQLGTAYTNQIFLVARLRKFFNIACESHMKVAFQGTKRLSYSGPDGSGNCEFNYSKDKEIQEIGNSLMGVENTIVTGARLEMLLVHDRLGLDQELASLADAIHNGNAAQPEAIRDVLTRIAEDDQVMDRARKRARTLLAVAN